MTDRHMTFQKYLAAGPGDALTATYDTENNRVRLDIAPGPGVRYATIYRRDSVGFLRLLQGPSSMLYLDGPKVVYDYTAPLNHLARYQVNFMRWQDDLHQIEYIREAAVTPIWDGRG